MSTAQARSQHIDGDRMSEMDWINRFERVGSNLDAAVLRLVTLRGESRFIRFVELRVPPGGVASPQCGRRPAF